MWSPASPDLNLIDSSEWYMLKVKIASVAHTSVEALKTSLLIEWAKIH